jgi:radical SAM superfamily enzyme YgiQ (UPF0313 family)
MKILLVYPKVNKKVVLKDELSMHEPLALEYIAAGVMENHDVEILDTRIDDSLTETLERFGPDIVGTTGYTIHLNNCKQILKTAKDFNDAILTVIGGHHATVRPEDFADTYIDIVVIGEGVFTFQEIVRQWENNKRFDDIQGIGIIRDGRIHTAPHRAYTALDKLPFPARVLTKKYRHKYCIRTMGQLASIRTSLGCLFRCKFCALWRITDGKYLTRKPECIVNELSEIEEDNIFFADDESMLRKDRMMKLADQIRDAGIRKKYRLYARSSTIKKWPELIEKWCDIGLTSVIVGFEGFTDEDLKKFNKATKISMNETAIAILKKNGIEICADFIVTQDFDREKFRRLYDYVQRLDLKMPIFPILTPLPGTTLYEEEKDRIISDDYDLYDFKHTLLPTKLSLKEFYNEFFKLNLLMFPRNRRYIYKHLFRATKYLPTFQSGYEVLSSLKRLHLDHSRN